MSASEALSEFQERFRLDELTVCERGEWVVSVRPGQITLGSMVVSSAAGVLTFESLDREAQADLGETFGMVERLAKSCFGAVRVNIVCLMMKDPVIHFHVLPRFDRVVEYSGRSWEDLDWPGPPTFGPAPTDDDVLLAVCETLRTESRSL